MVRNTKNCGGLKDNGSRLPSRDPSSIEDGRQRLAGQIGKLLARHWLRLRATGVTVPNSTQSKRFSHCRSINRPA